MGTFFVYILKSAICLALFYLFYRLLLSRETFHRFNRIAILGILFLSLIIPFCEVTIKNQTEISQTIITVEQLLMLASMETPIIPEHQVATVTWIHYTLIAFMLGIVFFVSKHTYSLIRLTRLIVSGKRSKLDKRITLVTHLKSTLAPFSWMNYIVISENDLNENGREILIHEMAHLRNKHSIDLVIADICIFFQWFNPAAWLLKQELQNIHEYEADESVIKEGVDAKQYQLLLIKKAVGTRLYSMANSFNHSKLKKRITMMLKEKSSPWARLKCLYVLPLAAIAISTFARSEVSNELNEISAIKVNNLTAIVEKNAEEKIPEVVQLKMDSVKPESEKKNQVKSTARYEEGTDIVDIKEDPLIVLNGKIVSKKILSENLSFDEIAEIIVLKDTKAIEKYGKQGEKGVLIITTKKSKAEDEMVGYINVKGHIKDKSDNKIVGAIVIIKDISTGTISDLNGNFILKVPKGAEITISYINMKSKTIKAEPVVFVTLEEE